MIIPEQYWDYLNVLNAVKAINYHQFVKKKTKKSRNRAVGKRKEKTKGHLGAVIKHVKRRMFGIEENTDRIFGLKFRSSQ